MRKPVLTLAAAVAAALALAGCGGGSSAGASGGSGSAGSAADPVKLTMWAGFTGGDRPGYDQIIKDFNASHPDIQVSLDVQPWDTITQKLPSAWLTGTGPDIAAPSSDPNAIAQYVKTNSVLPLTDTGEGDGKINTSAFPSTLNEEYTYNGKLYAVPANFATLSLYYNKKMFADAGITNPPATVADMAADAQKLTKPGGSQYGLALADNNTIQMWPILQWLGGGDIVDAKNCSALSSSASQSSLGSWATLVTKDGISPAGLTGAEADTLFSSGKAAMEMNGPWAGASFKTAGVDYGLAKIPVGSDGKPVTLGSTVPLAVSAKTKHPDQAQAFLAYWTSKAVQKQFSQTTGFPAFRSDLASDAQLAADPTIATFTSQVPDARLYLPHVPQATQVDANAYIPLIGEITRGADVAGATTKASSTLNGLTGCAS